MTPSIERQAYRETYRRTYYHICTCKPPSWILIYNFNYSTLSPPCNSIPIYLPRIVLSKVYFFCGLYYFTPFSRTRQEETR